MNNPNAKKNLKPFKTGGDERQNKNGRPKKTLTNVLNELKKEGYSRVSPANVSEAFEILLGLPLAKIAAIAKGEGDHPVIMRICARELTGKNGFQAVEKLLDRAQGKAKQAIEHSGEIQGGSAFKINIGGNVIDYE